MSFVSLASLTSSGNITTQNLVPAGAATASSAVTINPGGRDVVSIHITGTYTGALSVQKTTDGTNWETLAAGTTLTRHTTGAQSATIASATTGQFYLSVDGVVGVRVTALAAVTGTAAVTLVASDGNALVALDQPLPAGANTIGNANAIQSGVWTVQIGNTPNTTTILANPLTPAVVTTGDTGAKTATGNGATQTNTMSKGAHIVFNLGTVSGTTPTGVFKIQGSADSGTTWFDVPGATTASLTATGVYAIIVYPGVTPVAGTATTGSVAAVAMTLPRSWRVVWTIAGTTPSFTITNVQVSYII